MVLDVDFVLVSLKLELSKYHSFTNQYQYWLDIDVLSDNLAFTPQQTLAFMKCSLYIFIMVLLSGVRTEQIQ